MKVLVKTKGLSRQEWLKWRTKGIGGSDVPVIAGLNPYKSIYELWQEKTGQAGLKEAENDFIHFGSVLEPVVKREFMERTGLKVRAKNVLMQSSEYPFMLADVDGIVNEGGRACIFEAKTAIEYKRPVWEKGVPPGYLMQVQHYMAVTGTEKAYVAALVGGNGFYCHAVCRDDGMIKQIIEMEKAFWENCVVGGAEPVADGSGATTAWLGEQYRDSNGSAIELPEETLGIFRQYGEVSKQLDELSARKSALGNQLKSYLKENETGYIGEHRVSWKQVKAASFDKKKLKEELPDIYENYVVEKSHRRLSVA